MRKTYRLQYILQAVELKGYVRLYQSEIKGQLFISIYMNMFAITTCFSRSDDIRILKADRTRYVAIILFHIVK